jgi:large subunit ribosomal protein L22
VKAFLKNYRQSPRKVRLVANVIKSKNVTEAIALLDFIDKRASLPIKKLLVSAVANAKISSNLDAADLYVKSVSVDKGLTLKRSRPRSRGMSNPIHKHASHVTLVLGERSAKIPSAASSVPAATEKNTGAKKEVKKTPTALPPIETKAAKSKTAAPRMSTKKQS